MAEKVREEKQDKKGEEAAGKRADKSKKDEYREKIGELTESLQRLQAEFENYSKRMEKEKAEYEKRAKADIINKLLPVIDTFEIALKNTTDKEKFVRGAEMIYGNLLSVLENEGLRPIKTGGKQVDPYYHEVVMRQKSDREDGTIIEELQKGYMFHEKVLRYSKVKVSQKAEDNGQKAAGKEKTQREQTNQ